MALTNVNAIKLSSYYDVLKFNLRTGGNLLVLGQAGIGKTECAMQAIAEAGMNPIYINLSVLEYPDLVGLQTIVTDMKGRKHVDYACPKFLPLKEGSVPSRNVIIFDEVDKAKCELQNPLLELLQFRTINGQAVDVHGFVLTGNLPDEGAFSLPISHALTNRCMVYKLEAEFEAWLNWAVNARVNPLVTGFLSRNPEFFSRPAAEGDPTAYCRESPRSWTIAARDLDASLDMANPDQLVDLQTLLIAGRVGTTAAIKFKVWLEHYHYLVDYVDALVQNGKAPEGLTLDRQIVCAISACNEVVKVMSKSPKEFNKVLNNVFGWLSTLTPDLQICAVKSTITMDMIKQYKLIENPIFMKTFLQINHVLES